MSILDSNFTPEEFRQVLGRFATGVTIITTNDPHDGRPIGLTASSFNSVSLNPPLISWCLRKASSNYNAYSQANSFNVHILASDQVDVATQFATAPRDQRFNDIDYQPGRLGAPLLASQYCSSWMECSPFQAHEAGDHILFIGEVIHCGHTPKLPLVFHAGTFDLTPHAPSQS